MELDYLKIKTENGVMYGGDQKYLGKSAAKSGCGMIAACDMLLYLSKKNAGTISFSEYTAFAEKLRDEVFYNNTGNLIGIFPRRIAKVLTEKSGRKFKYYPAVKFFGRNGKKLAEFISEEIKSGIPVIVRVGADIGGLPYKIRYPASGKSFTGKMSWHYITVTGISESGILTFSSWGGKGSVSCAALYRHFGFTGGIIAADYRS
ncbi:MAG: hypothetical protein K2J73_06910 [Oscillospiraceae bacterium]|nr:hypothetical protein [Oscillospiraceae bacterium]